MFEGSRLIKIAALVQLSVVLLNGNLICEYKLFGLSNGYTCELSVNEELVNGTNEIEILGQHIGNRNDSDVVNCDGKQISIKTFPPICKKFTSLAIIFFSGSGLQFIEVDSFTGCTHIKSLDLDDNNLARTLPGMFRHNSLLFKLHLSNNSISQLHSKTFHGLHALEWLYLEKNRIRVLHAEVFARLTSLKRLYLGWNQISRISPGTLAQTINLEFLSLEGNQLRRLNANAFGFLAHLKGLEISQNAVDEIDVTLFEKLSGTQLYLQAERNLCINKAILSVENVSTQIIPFLSDCFINWNERICKFSTAGTYACTLSGLELTKSDERFNEMQFQHAEGRSNQDVVRISATDSIINFLPERLLGMFGNLEHIALDNVRLRELSGHSLRNCSQLGVMDFSRNEIQTLHRGTFTDCRNLERIILNCNQIASIEAETFAELSKLNLLDLSYNRLIGIPSAVGLAGSLSSLQSFYLSGNRIETLTSSSLQSLGRLKVLRLDANFIEVFSPEALMNVHDLEELHLQHNFISEIKPGTFRDTSKLKYLNLENNSIQSLHSSMLEELSELRYLDISSNNIEFIDEKVFNKAQNLEFLFATDNTCLSASFEFNNISAELENPLLMKCFEKL